MATRTATHTPDPVPGLPGGADPAAVAAALSRLGSLGRQGTPLGALTTYRVGGLAALGVVVRSNSDLVSVAGAAEISGLPILVVGRGSNLLVADEGFGGIALTLEGEPYSAVEVLPGPVVKAGASVPLPTLARRTAEAGLTGLEWAVGVPGSVGGGVRMNAGGHGSDISRTLIGCRLADLGQGASNAEPVEVGSPYLSLGYRSSSVSATTVVLDATFAMQPSDRDVSLRTIREIVTWRREHQPGGRNAGSVFTNPGGPAGSLGGAQGGVGLSAGALVDESGLKGRRVGSAQVSPRHANFIQADSGGSAGDVYALIQLVRREVAARSGVVLEPEVRLVGFPQPLVEIDV